MNTELTYFKDFTPKSFNDLVQMQVQVAGRQRTCLQEMSKEASLYSLFLSMGPYRSGRPSDEKAMNTELTCLKGFTPKSFNDLVQMQVHGGYPIGEKGIEAESL